MRTLELYRIDLKRLTPAAPIQMDYVLGNEFFEDVDGQEVRQGELKVSLSIMRASSSFELKFHIRGSIVVTCDRCLEAMEIPVETDNRLIVTLGEAFAEISDDHIIVSEEEGFINVAWYIYEFIALAIPIQHIHPPGACNELMMSKLREFSVDEVGDESGNDMYDEGIHPEQGNRPTDPRWDALRTIIEDN